MASPQEHTTYCFNIDYKMLQDFPTLQTKKALEFLILREFPTSDTFKMVPIIKWESNSTFTMTWNRRVTRKAVMKRTENLPFLSSPEYRVPHTAEENEYLQELKKLTKLHARKKPKQTEEVTNDKTFEFERDIDVHVTKKAKRN